MSIDPYCWAPLCSSATPADCLGPPGPDAIDGYLFSVLCCKCACALACQTPRIALGQCSDRLGHADSSHAPETSYKVTSHSLVVLITSNDPHWQPLLHYTIAVGARIITSSVLRIALQHWALIAHPTIAGGRHHLASSSARSNDLRGLFSVRPKWAIYGWRYSSASCVSTCVAQVTLLPILAL